MFSPRGLGIAVAFVIILLTVSLPVGVKRNHTFWYDFFDAGHFPLFALLALLIYWSPPAVGLKLEKRCAVAAGIAATFAILIELFQPWVGRTASSTDLINGLLGIAAAASGAYLWARKSPRVVRMLHAVLTLVVAVLLLLPAISEYRALHWRSTQFPLLAGFETELEMALWRGMTSLPSAPTSLQRSTEHATDGSFALDIETRGGAYPGVRYSAGQLDWSGHDALVLDLFNPGESFVLNIRIDDDGDCTLFAQRFNRRIPLEPGLQTLRIPTADIRQGPRERELNLQAIRSVYLFTGKHDAPRRFYVDHARLE